MRLGRPHEDQICGPNCRYRELYEGTQASLAEMAGSQSRALARAGKLRDGIIHVLRTTMPRSFNDLERQVGHRVAATDDDTLLAYFAYLVDLAVTGSVDQDNWPGREALRIALGELGIDTSSNEPVEWAAAAERWGAQQRAAVREERIASMPQPPRNPRTGKSFAQAVIDRERARARTLAQVAEERGERLPELGPGATAAAATSGVVSAPPVSAPPVSAEPAASREQFEPIAPPAAQPIKTPTPGRDAAAAPAPLGDRASGGGDTPAPAKSPAADWMTIPGDWTPEADDSPSEEPASSSDDSGFLDIDDDFTAGGPDGDVLDIGGPGDSDPWDEGGPGGGDLFDDWAAPSEDTIVEPHSDNEPLEAFGGPEPEPVRSPAADVVTSPPAAPAAEPAVVSAEPVVAAEPAAKQAEPTGPRALPAGVPAAPAEDPKPQVVKPVFRPDLFGGGTTKPPPSRRKRRPRVQAQPPDAGLDVPGELAPSEIDERTRRSIDAAVTIPRPVFTSDLVETFGHDAVEAWMEEHRRDGSVFRFISPKARHVQRGSLVVPVAYQRQAAVEFQRSWWADCLRTYAGARLYEVATVMHTFGDQIVTHEVWDHGNTIQLRVTQPRGLVGAVIVSGSDMSSGSAAREAVAADIEALMRDRVELIVVAPTLDPAYEPTVAAVIEDAAARQWKPSCPIVASRSWDWVSGRTSVLQHLLG